MMVAIIKKTTHLELFHLVRVITVLYYMYGLQSFKMFCHFYLVKQIFVGDKNAK